MALASRDDPRTVKDWAKHVGTNESSLRLWCRLARCDSKDSLDFARLLRAVAAAAKDPGAHPIDFLDVGDDRTLRRLLSRAGLAVSTPLPWSLAYLMEHHSFVLDRTAVRTVADLESQPSLSSAIHVAPRFALSWSPWERGTTAIRFGGGRYLEWIPTSIIESTHRIDGVRQREFLVRRPEFPVADLTSAGGDSTPSRRYELAENLSLPTHWRWSIAIDHRISATTSMLASLSQVRGRGLLRGASIGAAAAGVLPGQALPSSGIRAENSGRRDETRARLQLWWRPKPLLSLTAVYLAGRVLDDTDGPFSPPADPVHPETEWGPAAGDARHRLVTTAVLRMPNRVLLFLDVVGQSGTPFPIRTGRDDNGDGFVTDRPRGIARNSARGDARWLTRMSLQWQKNLGGDPAAAPGQAGTPAALVVSLNVDNVLNRANHVTYVGVLGSPRFGRPVGSLPGRRVALRASIAFR